MGNCCKSTPKIDTIVKVLAITSGDTIVVENNESKSAYQIKLSGIIVPGSSEALISGFSEQSYTKPTKTKSQPKLKRTATIGEISMADSTRFALETLIKGHNVTLKNITVNGADIRAEVHLGELNINVWLINKRLAVHELDPIPLDWVKHFNEQEF